MYVNKRTVCASIEHQMRGPRLSVFRCLSIFEFKVPKSESISETTFTTKHIKRYTRFNKVSQAVLIITPVSSPEASLIRLVCLTQLRPKTRNSAVGHEPKCSE